MNTCASCGAVNEAGALVCADCGKDLEAEAMQFGLVCPACDSYNGPGVTVCQACGQGLVPAGFTGFFEAANLAVPGEETPAAPAPAAPPHPAALPEEAHHRGMVSFPPSGAGLTLNGER